MVAATGVLVGSIGMMDECVRCYAEATGLPLREAAACASGAAARLLGLEASGMTCDVWRVMGDF